MKKNLLLIISLILSNTIYAQLDDEIRPSVNARQFVSGLSSVVGLRAGQVSVSLPLFSLPGKGVDVPISLSFNQEGITHESEASGVGLGWSLLAGGVITATIRDRDDNLNTKYNDISWHYNDNYLQNVWYEQSQRLVPDVVSALATISSRDSEPDSYQYAFLGYSGDVYFRFKHDDQTIRYATLYPDGLFKIEKTSMGYKIIADDGIEYYFECQEKNVLSSASYTTSWFLSQIRTPQGGLVSFQYEDEVGYDLSSNRDYPRYPQITTKRLVRIDSDYGYVEFRPSSRSDVPESKCIVNIELYNTNGILTKGYMLEYGANFTNTIQAPVSWHNERLRLSQIKEYNRAGEYLPPYKFEYEYEFLRSRSSFKIPITSGVPNPIRTWAMPPSALALVDRNDLGQPACWFENQGSPSEHLYGFRTIVDDIDDTSDYFCLSKITFPTGGSESYSYGQHDYYYVSGSYDVRDTPNSHIKGKRLTQKTVADNNGNTQLFEYKYRLHNENYQLQSTSSGVLVAPSFHTSALYTPLYDFNRHNRLLATPYTTDQPQNNLSGSPVCYTEVEEVFKSANNGEILGRKIYYFNRKTTILPQNYVYLDYNFNYGVSGKANLLIPIGNVLYGDQPYMSNFTQSKLAYIAYPVGRFRIYDETQGKVLKEITLDNQGRVVQKIENNYSISLFPRMYGYNICHYQDGDGKNRYLISVSSYSAEYSNLQKSITTHYFPDLGIDPITKEQSFGYATGNRLTTNITKQSNGESIETRYIYPDFINFSTQSNLSMQASAIKKMIELNQINSPVQVTTKKGEKYIGGSYTTYKQVGSKVVVVDSVFNMESRFETLVPTPVVNASGKLERHSIFSVEKAYSAYDSNFNPIGMMLKDGISRAFKWGHGGQYIVARIENYSHSQLNSNTTLLSLLGSLDNYAIITDTNLASLSSLNQSIRNNLPASAMITTYTYHPQYGMTSVTDPRGFATCYAYDNFGRLTHIYQIKNGAREILESYEYHYVNQ